LFVLVLRTAAAIRTAAMTGLQAIVQDMGLAAGVVRELGSDILPQVRLLTCEQTHQIYTCLEY